MHVVNEHITIALMGTIIRLVQGSPSHGGNEAEIFITAISGGKKIF